MAPRLAAENPVVSLQNGLDDARLGTTVRKAATVGLAAPLTRRLGELIGELETGEARGAAAAAPPS